MKFTIEVDIAPEEIPQATELLRILRELANHVRPKQPRELFEKIFSRLLSVESNQIDSAIDATAGVWFLRFLLALSYCHFAVCFHRHPSNLSYSRL